MSEKKKNVDFIKDILIEIFREKEGRYLRLRNVRDHINRNQNRPGWIRAVMYTNISTLLTELIEETREDPEKYGGMLYRTGKGVYIFANLPKGEIPDPPEGEDPPSGFGPALPVDMDNPATIESVYDEMDLFGTPSGPREYMFRIRYHALMLSEYAKDLDRIIKEKDKEIEIRDKKLRSYRIRTCKRCGDSFQAETSQETKCEKCKINSGPN